MKLVGLGSVLAALSLAASACGSSHSATSNGLNSAAYRSLPQPLQAIIRRSLAKPDDGPIREIDVYGPGTEAALSPTASAGSVNDPDRKKDFYLVVWQGRFVCTWCSSPGATGANRPPPMPHGTIETTMWSASRGVTESGIGGSRRPAAMTRFHPTAVITLS